jgi:hypothetical protein
MTSTVLEQTACLNCGASLAGAYCERCGQKAGPPNPTLHEFLHDLTHEILHVDGKIFRTVRLLFVRPGFLTAEQCAGRKSSYVAPIRLYLIFSVAYFAAAAYTAKPPQITADDRRGTVISSGGVKISGTSLLAGRSNEEVTERFRHAQHDWIPRLMFVLLPVSALLVAMTTRRSGRNLPQHLYFVLHVHAATFAAMAVTAMAGAFIGDRGQAVLGGLLLAFVGWYLVTAFHTVYGGRWRRAVARSAAFGLGYFAVVIIATVAVFVAALLL